MHREREGKQRTAQVVPVKTVMHSGLLHTRTTGQPVWQNSYITSFMRLCPVRSLADRSKCLLATLYIGGAHHDIGHIAFGKSIHILYSHIGGCQVFKNLSQRASLVGTIQMYHIGEHHREVGIAQYLHRFVYVRNDESQYTEVWRLGHAERMHIDVVTTQNLCHLIDSSCPVLKEH